MHKHARLLMASRIAGGRRSLSVVALIDALRLFESYLFLDIIELN